MRFVVFLTVMMIFLDITSVKAQTYLSEPMCFTLINNAPYSVFGDVATAPDKTSTEGLKAPHKSSFSLKENDRIPVCTRGPLFDGDQIRITLRTLFPIFECKTRIWQGVEINIHGQRKENGTDTWVECY